MIVHPPATAGGTDNMLRTLTEPLPEGEEQKHVVLTARLTPRSRPGLRLSRPLRGLMLGILGLDV